PAKNTTSRKAFFKFKTNVSGAKFFCQFGKKKFVSCKSPQTYKRLKAPGKYSFRVRAKANGLTGPTVTYRWSIRKLL
ncbi:MAG: hypothetical protein ACSLFI_10645, partial [Solirubrobacterales bacterium]